MNEQLLSTIVGALTIGIGFIGWRCGRTSPSAITRSLCFPVFLATSVLGLGSILGPVLEAFLQQ